MLDFSVTFLITIFNITVLFLVLRVLLFKPVTKFMDERARRVRDSIDQSEKDKFQAKALLAQYEAQIKTAEVEAEAILKNARDQAQLEAKKIIGEGRASAETVISRARKELEMERQAALASFREQAAALVVEAAGRLLAREIKSEDNLKYASLLLEETISTTSANDGTGGE